MRYIGLALAVVAHAATAQRPYDLPIRRATVRTIAEFPGVNIGRITPSGNPARLYYNVGDKLYVFDVNTKKSALVAEGDIGNLNISPMNDRLVFARDTEDGKVSNVWMMPLDTKTGLATAPARRLALTPGDQPRVSPDGKWVAFAAYDSSDYSATQHLAIIGADGGIERVVTRLTGGIGTIQWAPDGRTIYLEALCRCDPRVSPTKRWKLLRVAVAGGAVDTLGIEFQGAAPGLSPDGHLMGLQEDDSESDYVVADAHGVPVSRFSVGEPGHLGWAWSPSWNGTRSLVGNGNFDKPAVRVAELSSGTSREIVPADVLPEAPFWSPDGKSIAMFATSQSKRVLLVVDATTGKRTEFSAGVVQACCVHDDSRSLQWSPDGKSIAFHGEYREPLRVIELANGAMRQIGPKATLIGEYRWRSDSRALQYTATRSARDAYRTIHETTLDGNDRTLFDKVPNSFGPAGMRNDSTAVFNSDTGVFLISIRTRTLTRLGPFFSPWVVSNRQGTAFAMRQWQSHRLDLATVDARGVHASMLNFPSLLEVWAPYHQVPLAFHPDGRLIVVGHATGGQSAVYAADPKGSEPQKLLDLPYSTRCLDLSPNGRFLVYTVGPITGAIAQIDLTSFVPVTQSSKHNP